MRNIEEIGENETWASKEKKRKKACHLVECQLATNILAQVCSIVV